MATRQGRKRGGSIPSGIYADHKGRLYSVSGTGQDTETGEPFVVLESLSDLKTKNCPVSEFNGHVEAFGGRYRRFTPADALNLYALHMDSGRLTLAA